MPGVSCCGVMNDIEERWAIGEALQAAGNCSGGLFSVPGRIRNANALERMSDLVCLFALLFSDGV